MDATVTQAHEEDAKDANPTVEDLSQPKLVDIINNGFEDLFEHDYWE